MHEEGIVSILAGFYPKGCIEYHPWQCLVFCIPFLPRAHALGVKQLVLSVRLSYNFFFEKQAKTVSKQQNNDEMRQILAHVYLVEHKAVLVLAFSTFFLLSVSSTILIRQ